MVVLIILVISVLEGCVVVLGTMVALVTVVTAAGIPDSLIKTYG